MMGIWLGGDRGDGLALGEQWGQSHNWVDSGVFTAKVIRRRLEEDGQGFGLWTC